MDLKSFILLAGACHGLVMSVILWKRDSQKNRFFILLLLSVSFFLLIHFAAPFQRLPKISLLSYVLIYSYIPIYILHLQKNLATRIVGKNWLLILPSAVFFIACIPYLSLSNEALRNATFTSLAITDLLAIIVNVLLLIKSSGLIHTQDSGNYFRPNQYFHGLMILSSLMWLVGILNISGLIHLPLSFDLNTVFIGMSLFVFGIGYFLMFQHNQPVKNGSSYEKLKIPKADQERIASVLLDYLYESKPYLNPDCSLSEVSISLDIEKTRLSFVINKYMNTNFNRLINVMRVKEFLELSRNQQMEIYDLVGVAQKAGFRSKSTFYKSFREVYGVSPKEYLSDNSPNLLTQITPTKLEGLLQGK